MSDHGRGLLLFAAAGHHRGGLVQLFGESETISRDAYFVYPEELKSVARVQVFRVFLVA